MRVTETIIMRVGEMTIGTPIHQAMKAEVVKDRMLIYIKVPTVIVLSQPVPHLLITMSNVLDHPQVLRLLLQ